MARDITELENLVWLDSNMAESHPEEEDNFELQFIHEYFASI